MLSKLYIKNLAIIEELEVEFDTAFNVFTGETGAGKSLIIGAIELLLGFRPATKMVRSGAKDALLIGVFDLSGKEIQKEFAEICDAPLEDGELILQRKILPSGKTSNSAGGVPITLATLKQIGQMLVDIHGQHENQSLLSPVTQLRLLDVFANTEKLADEFSCVHREWRGAIESRDELTQHAELREQQIDLFEFQLGEIDAAEIKTGEQEELEHENCQLSNVEKLRELAGLITCELEESEFPVLDILRKLAGKSQQLANIDGSLKSLPEQFESAIIELDDVAKTIANYVDELEFDPRRLSELDERLTLLSRLAKKYTNGDVDALLDYREATALKLETLRSQQTDLDSIDSRIAELAARRIEIGEKLSAKRKKAAVKLSDAVNGELSELAMPLAKFEVGFEEVSDGSPSHHGLENAQYMIRTNPGQPFMPLRQIASAGELSRITLGIKSILASPGKSSVLVFDEVDSNVGGRLGEVIGTKLAKLASSQQVLCISHLPQIAAFAQRHFVVAKQASKTQTASSIRIVNGEDRTREIAEMISGKKITDTTLKQANEMLVDCGKIACGSSTKSRKK